MWQEESAWGLAPYRVIYKGNLLPETQLFCVRQILQKTFSCKYYSLHRLGFYFLDSDTQVSSSHLLNDGESRTMSTTHQHEWRVHESSYCRD